MNFFKENRLVWLAVGLSSSPEAADNPPEVVEADEASLQEQLDKKKEVWESKVDGAEQVMDQLKDIYGETEGVNKRHEELDTALSEILGRLDQEIEDTDEARDAELKALDQAILDQIKELTGETEATENLEQEVKEEMAEAAGVTVEEADEALAELTKDPEDDTEEPDAEPESKEEYPIPEYQGEIAQRALAQPGTSIPFKGEKVLPQDRLDGYGITQTEGFEIGMKIVDQGGEAYQVQDFSKTTFSHKFPGEAEFKKQFPSAKLPDGDGSVTVTEDLYLSDSRPRPFKGLHRRRDLIISVERDGDNNITNIFVEVTNIRFGDPPSHEVYIPLGKPMSEVKTAQDILYPPGFEPQEGVEYSDAQGEGVEGSVSAPESFGSMQEELDWYTRQVIEMKDVDPNNPTLAEMPDFLKKKITVAGSQRRFARLAKAARTETDPAKQEELLNQLREHKDLILASVNNVNIENRPEYQTYQSFFNPEQGLVYGADGYDETLFDDQFVAAGTILNNHFFDDAIDGEGNYVQLEGAKIVFNKNKNGKPAISGNFEVKVKGYPNEDTVKFDFADINGSNWEDAMAKAMTALTEDKAVKKGVRKQMRQRNRYIRKGELPGGKTTENIEENADIVEPLELSTGIILSPEQRLVWESKAKVSSLSKQEYVDYIKQISDHEMILTQNLVNDMNESFGNLRVEMTVDSSFDRHEKREIRLRLGDQEAVVTLKPAYVTRMFKYDKGGGCEIIVDGDRTFLNTKDAVIAAYEDLTDLKYPVATEELLPLEALSQGIARREADGSYTMLKTGWEYNEDLGMFVGSDEGSQSIAIADGSVEPDETTDEPTDTGSSVWDTIEPPAPTPVVQPSADSEPTAQPEPLPTAQPSADVEPAPTPQPTPITQSTDEPPSAPAPQPEPITEREPDTTPFAPTSTYATAEARQEDEALSTFDWSMDDSEPDSVAQQPDDASPAPAAQPVADADTDDVEWGQVDDLEPETAATQTEVEEDLTFAPAAISIEPTPAPEPAPRDDAMLAGLTSPLVDTPVPEPVATPQPVAPTPEPVSQPEDPLFAGIDAPTIETTFEPAPSQPSESLFPSYRSPSQPEPPVFREPVATAPTPTPQPEPEVLVPTLEQAPENQAEIFDNLALRMSNLEGRDRYVVAQQVYEMIQNDNDLVTRLPADEQIRFYYVVEPGSMKFQEHRLNFIKDNPDAVVYFLREKPELALTIMKDFEKKNAWAEVEKIYQNMLETNADMSYDAHWLGVQSARATKLGEPEMLKRLEQALSFDETREAREWFDELNEKLNPTPEPAPEVTPTPEPVTETEPEPSPSLSDFDTGEPTEILPQDYSPADALSEGIAVKTGDSSYEIKPGWRYSSTIGLFLPSDTTESTKLSAEQVASLEAELGISAPAETSEKSSELPTQEQTFAKFGEDLIEQYDGQEIEGHNFSVKKIDDSHYKLSADSRTFDINLSNFSQYQAGVVTPTDYLSFDVEISENGTVIEKTTQDSISPDEDTFVSHIFDVVLASVDGPIFAALDSDVSDQDAVADVSE